MQMPLPTLRWAVACLLVVALSTAAEASYRRTLTEPAPIAVPGPQAKPDPTAKCPPTPGDILGPYYQDAGISPVRSLKGRVFCKPSQGKSFETLQMSGTIKGPDCKPINGEAAGLILEIWQADNTGTYDNNTNIKDSNNCRAALQISKDGTYSYTTIHPGKYGASKDCLRPAHIHLKVTATKMPEAYTPLITQMYFPNDSNLGAKDCACTGCSSGDKRLYAQMVSGKKGEAAVFDIYLAKGWPAPVAEPGPVSTYGHH